MIISTDTLVINTHTTSPFVSSISMGHVHPSSKAMLNIQMVFQPYIYIYIYMYMYNIYIYIYIPEVVVEV